MIHIFEDWDDSQFKDENFCGRTAHLKFHNSVEKYIVSKMLLVMDDITDSDMVCVSYLRFLYERVMEDRRLRPQDRSLVIMLDKMEEDLMYQRDAFLGRVAFSISFLEADVLLLVGMNEDQDLIRRVLGRIHKIRNTWVVQRKEDREAEREKIKPERVKKYLDEYIIGQEDAKKIISVAIYGHMKRIWHPEIHFADNVVLLIGPSGCGKTEIMRKIRDLTHLPMVFTDVSSLGASQYRGRHKEDILLSLWEAAGRKKGAAENGIIFMDEFDKLLLPAFSERGVNIHDDVQSQLLTMLEGSDVELKADGEIFTLNTSGILFVLAGAFQGIEEYIRADRMKHENIAGNIGFMSVPAKEMDLSIIREHINHDVLIQYGMKRELAGRISSIAVLEKLSRENLLKIMTEPKDSLLKRYTREFELSCGAKLEITKDALNAIADKVLDEPTGARALLSVIRRILRDSLYELPGRKDISIIRITKDTVVLETPPELIRKDEFEKQPEPEGYTRCRGVEHGTEDSDK